MSEKEISRRGFVRQSAMGIGGLTLAGIGNKTIANPTTGSSECHSIDNSQPVYPDYTLNAGDIVLENEQTRLVLGSDAIAKSLVCKSTGEECLISGHNIPISSIFQNRPYNNEIKLAHPCEESTFKANSLERDGDRLIIGYELIHYKVVLNVTIQSDYIEFLLEDYIVPDDAYGLGVRMISAPVQQIWFLQLPVRRRSFYGDWLQVVWDDRVTMNILAPEPFTRITADASNNYYILKAGADRQIRLKGIRACLINTPTNRFLDTVGRIEKDYGLPDSVGARRNKEYLYSYYFSGNINPDNVDRHLKYARMGGFRALSIYYPAFLESRGYRMIGNYRWNRSIYPNGEEDFKRFLQKIDSEGIIPGYHFLHSHIGLDSKYVTPVPDHRLNLIRNFTLTVPLDEKTTTITIDQYPGDLELAEGRRVIKVGTELISFTGFTEDRPYHLTDCERGVLGTAADSHPAGSIVGVLDVSEFGAQSVYINQDNDLQDEVAEKIAEIYNLGFKFCYFDGSEGVNPPFWCNVAYAQWKVMKRFNSVPLFAEGAAKTHFSWHLLSRANAFDVFRPEVLKESIREHPAAEAPRMQQNFSHLNFGWLGYFLPGEETVGTQPDMLEYASSRAAAWDCPISLQSNLDYFDRHPRTPDNLEVLRRWEEVRINRWLTEDQKMSLRNLEQEHILLINEAGEYELAACDQILNIADHSRDVRAFLFERENDLWVVYWHISGTGKLNLPVSPGNVSLYEDLQNSERLFLARKKNRMIIPADHRRYLHFQDLSRDEILSAFSEALILSG